MTFASVVAGSVLSACVTSTNGRLELKVITLKHPSFLPTAFHYPELNTSQFFRSSWVRTGMVVSVVGMVYSAATT